MNIFILDVEIKNSARFHTDKHCVKMILEHCQMLCTAILVNNKLKNILNIVDIPYKKTHVNHPCTIWASKNFDNFAWLVAYTHELYEEFKYRYSKDHLSYITLKNKGIITNSIITYGSSLSILDLSPACVMPNDCITGTVIENYRNDYKQYKSQLFKWTKREKPYWI